MSLPTADEGDIKKRYSIEMFEELIQTVSILKQELSNLKTVVTQLS
jgi:NADH:ubiquinone oxidoreductase subunit D